MKNIIRALLVIFSIIFTNVSLSAELTTPMVEQLMQRMDNAINNLNANRVAQELSDDVTIDITVDFLGSVQTLKISKSEYITQLQQGWAQYKNYSFRRSNTSISIAKNKAFVSAKGSENMTLNDQDISSTSEFYTLIELIGGKPLVTKITGNVTATIAHDI